MEVEGSFRLYPQHHLRGAFKSQYSPQNSFRLHYYHFSALPSFQPVHHRCTMSPEPLSFVLPDLEAHCPYPLRLNAHCVPASRASEAWLLAEAHTAVSARRRSAFLRLRGGELTAACYPDASTTRLRDVADFLNFLFTLDDWSDEFGARDTCGLAECVMRALEDPEGYKTQKAAGRLAKR